jgi:hypothetical protein
MVTMVVIMILMILMMMMMMMILMMIIIIILTMACGLRVCVCVCVGTHVFVCMRARVCIHVPACVCVRERERERDIIRSASAYEHCVLPVGLQSKDSPLPLFQTRTDPSFAAALKATQAPESTATMWTSAQQIKTTASHAQIARIQMAHSHVSACKLGTACLREMAWTAGTQTSVSRARIIAAFMQRYAVHVSVPVWETFECVHGIVEIVEF